MKASSVGSGMEALRLSQGALRQESSIGRYTNAVEHESASLCLLERVGYDATFNEEIPVQEIAKEDP